MSDDFMELDKAMEIVLELAKQGKLRDHQTDPELEDEREKQELAIDTVEDFAMNNIV